MYNEVFLQQLSKTVRDHRKKAGLSQNELAEYAGVGKTVIFDIEHGKATLQLQTILKILNALTINITLTSPLLNNQRINNESR